MQTKRGQGTLSLKRDEGATVDSRQQQRVTAPAPAQFRLDIAVSQGNVHEFDLWRFGLSPLVSVEVSPAVRSSFSVNMTSYQFADLAIASGTSSGATYERSGQTIARSGLDNISLLFYPVAGRLDIEGEETDVCPGDILVLDLTRRFKVQVPDFESLSIILPRTALAPLVSNLDALHGLVLPKASPLNTMLIQHFHTLFAELPALAPQDCRAAARGTAALIAAMVGANTNGRGVAPKAAAVSSLHALRRIVDANLANSDLGPEFLSLKLGMSRATLYRLFEPLGGVRRYIQQRRLTRAYQTITDPENGSERVGAIAARYGFRNDSVFSRAFRDAYGLSPTDVREAWRSDSSAAFGHAKENEFIIMNRWLLGLEAAGR